MKKLKNDILIYCIIGGLSFLIGWYLLNSLIYGGVYGILCVLGAWFVIKQKKKNDLKYEQINNAYTFTNMLNVQMLATKNVYEAYKMIENYVSVDFANIINEDLHAQLLDIANQYDINGFKMYINTLIIYDNDGGEFSKMEEIPSSICQKCKVYYDGMKKRKEGKLFDISTLYFLWIFVLIFLKSALSEYYDIMAEKFSFQLIMLAVLLVGAGSYVLAFLQNYKNNIRGL